MRVRWRAAAHKHERLVAGVPQLVRHAGRDDHGVAGPDVCLQAAEPHPAGPRREVVDLLACAVEVLGRLPARGHGGLRQRLVDRVAGRHADKLADGRAVGGHERLAIFQADGLHEARDRVDDVRATPEAGAAR